MAAAGPPRNARWGFAAVVGFFGAPVFAGAAPPQAMRSGEIRVAEQVRACRWAVLSGARASTVFCP